MIFQADFYKGITKNGLNIPYFIEIYIIHDGDFVCIGQLEDTIKEYMLHDKRGRYSWHIIKRGWVKKVRLPLGGYSTENQAPHIKGKKVKLTKPLTI